MMKTRLTAFAALCLFALPALAAIQLAPGEWRETESGTENGERVKPEVTTNCITAREARDPVKALSRLKTAAGQKCKALHVQSNGNMLAFDITCGDPSKISIAVSLSIMFSSSRHYSGTVKSKVVFAGKTTTTDKQIEAKWIGAVCRKH